MNPVDPEHNRKVAAWLADCLAPLVGDLPAAPPTVVTRVVLVAADRGLVKAAEHVAAAVDRLVQAKFTPEERPARMALERAAKTLRTEVRRRSSKSQNSKQEQTT